MMCRIVMDKNGMWCLHCLSGLLSVSESIIS